MVVHLDAVARTKAELAQANWTNTTPKTPATGFEVAVSQGWLRWLDWKRSGIAQMCPHTEPRVHVLACDEDRVRFIRIGPNPFGRLACNMGVVFDAGLDPVSSPSEPGHPRVGYRTDAARLDEGDVGRLIGFMEDAFQAWVRAGEPDCGEGF